MLGQQETAGRRQDRDVEAGSGFRIPQRPADARRSAKNRALASLLSQTPIVLRPSVLGSVLIEAEPEFERNGSEGYGSWSPKARRDMQSFMRSRAG